MDAKRVRILSAFIVGAVLLAGCGSTGQAAPTSPKKAVKNTVNDVKRPAKTAVNNVKGPAKKTAHKVKSTTHKAIKKAKAPASHKLTKTRAGSGSHGPMDGKGTKGSAASSGTMKVLGFWAPNLAQSPSTLANQKGSISYMAPFWYSMTASGTISSKVDPVLLAEIHKKKLPILAMVNDLTGKQTFLTSPATRKAAVHSIDSLIAKNHYAGVNIDFEPPHTLLAGDLTLFMRELHDSLPKSDQIVLDVVPHSGGAYDFRALAPEVTQFQLMSYDQHSDGTAPGPVAALNWVTSITTRLKTLVPANKIYLGIALYGYKWPSASSTTAATIPYYAITPAMKSKEVWNTRYDEMTETIGPAVYWWENRQGIAQKIALAKKEHLYGIALWEVGYATPAIYSELLKDVGKQAVHP